MFSLTLVNCIDESRYMIDRVREEENTDAEIEPIDFSRIKMSTAEKKREKWLRTYRMLQNMEDGDTTTISNGKALRKQRTEEQIKEDEYFIKNSNLFEPTVDLPSNEELEYSEKWKIEAYKATKEFIKKGINKKPNCKVIAEGIYESNIVRYIGSQTFQVRVFFKFNCNEGYNNPSYFWTESTLNKYGKWSIRLIDQQFAD